MLKVKNVTTKFGELAEVNDLSFEVAKGQVFGIAGPNGAGKSTLYNLITGFYKFDGIIEFDGKNISGLPIHKIARLWISRTFQIPQIFESMTVEESVNLGCHFGNTGNYDPGYPACTTRCPHRSLPGTKWRACGNIRRSTTDTIQR